MEGRDRWSFLCSGFDFYVNFFRRMKIKTIMAFSWKRNGKKGMKDKCSSCNRIIFVIKDSRIALLASLNSYFNLHRRIKVNSLHALIENEKIKWGHCACEWNLKNTSRKLFSLNVAFVQVLKYSRHWPVSSMIPSSQNSPGFYMQKNVYAQTKYRILPVKVQSFTEMTTMPTGCTVSLQLINSIWKWSNKHSYHLIFLFLCS